MPACAAPTTQMNAPPPKSPNLRPNCPTPPHPPTPPPQVYTGKRVYAGMRHTQVLDCIHKGVRPVFPAASPHSFVCLAELCWAENPAVRPSFSTVASVLQELLSDCVF